MIDDTIARIEAQLRTSESISPARREELLRLLATLKSEVSTLSTTHDEQAQSIVKFAQVSAHEATRMARDPRLLDLSLLGLRTSVQGFEQSHPNLVRIVNTISHTLSSLGI